MTKRIEYVVCPLCANTKVIHSSKRACLPFEINATEFIQIREGGGKVGTGKKGRGQGRGVGWYKVNSISMQDAINSGGAYLVLAQDLVRQTLKVSAELKRLGLIP